MKPLFSLKFTICLGIILLFPYLMSNTTFEPYPAILLPSGATEINLQEGIIRVRKLSLYGYDSQGELQKIDAREFLSPIPGQYLYAISRSDFGLSTNPTKKMFIRGFGEVEVNRKGFGLENQEEAKLWLSNKLSQLGLSTTAFVIRSEFKELDANSGKEISQEVRNERTISLY